MCAPCRWDDITMWNRLSLACPIHRMIPVGWFCMGMTSCQCGGPIVELRWSYHRLISTMGFPTLVRLRLYIESGPWLNVQPIDCELYMPMTNSWHNIFYVSVPVIALTWMNKKNKKKPQKHNHSVWFLAESTNCTWMSAVGFHKHESHRSSMMLKLFC